MNKRAISRKKPRPRKSKTSKARQLSEHLSDAFPIVGIGASAGGFEAFAAMLKELPEDTGMAFVFVQHLDPTHSSVLTEIIARSTKIPVVEVSDGMRVTPNRIYVIPANATMILRNRELHLGARMLIRGRHLPIDHFFYSLADECGTQAIGVVLSGSASDGTEGCRAIKSGGGITFAQDEKSAKFASMPHSAISAGCIDFVLTPKEIARELARIARHPYIAEKRAKDENLSIVGGEDLNALLRLVRERSGVDFGMYKQTTLQRRIRRRIVLHRFEKIKDYLRYIRENPAEIDELYRDILIHVTGFFRDKDSYDALTLRVFPTLFHGRNLEERPIRIWVPGCSTGEEVYSIAICLLEYLWSSARKSGQAMMTKAVQIFGTDISEAALDRARVGLYTNAAIADVSPARLSRFFVRLDGGYQINRSIRDMCVFARQNVAKDPPFSNIDLITCRNLLIYLGAELQKRVIPTLHYALKPDGYLMLGGSESLGAFADHFILIDKKNKIYQKKRSATRLITYFTGGDFASRRPDPARNVAPVASNVSVDKEVERVLVDRFVPASIVVNEHMEIVQFRGRTGAYLEPAPGHPTFSLSKMAREGLLVDLRAAITKARKSNSIVRSERVHVKSNGHSREVDLEVIPVRGPDAAERFYVVVFQDSRKPVHDSQPTARGKSPERSASARENEHLKLELDQLREQLKTLIEEHETTSEEFKSVNEEVLSSNEELQSTNEELETAKEELQSSNEELTTLNEELQNRNLELSLANNDLLNLLGNVNIPVVMVDDDLRIRRFTPPAQSLLNLIPTDVGRRLQDIRPNLDVDDIESTVRLTIETATLQEREVHEKGGAWYMMRVGPYKTRDKKIDGAVISFLDIDELKQRVNESRNLADSLIQNAREALLVLDSTLKVSSVNREFCRIFQMSPDQVQGHSLSDLGAGQWIPPGLLARLQQLVSNDSRIDEVEFRHEFPQLGLKTMVFNARRIRPTRGQPIVLLSVEDITDYKKHQEDLQTHTALLELASDAIFVRDLSGTIHLWNRGAERLYGWTKQEVLGKPVSEMLKTRFPAPVAEINKQLLHSGYWEGELVHTRKDGQEIYVESRWSLHRETEPYTILELNTDITERKRYQQQLQTLSGKLMQVQDEERRRIARDLHDSTGQKLVALKLSLEGMRNSSNGPRAQEIELVDQVLQDIRTLSQLLHPPLLEEAGLVSATKWLVEGFSGRSGIKVRLDVSDGIDRLSSDVELALFRVIQEALNNIHRHSGAKSARVRVAKKNGALVLKISDDGRGMTVSPGTGDGATLGVGLLGMRERLSQLNGRLTIASGDSGTVIEAEVPLRPRQSKD
jgi:two-component system CheB/CheR fusion protein